MTTTETVPTPSRSGALTVPELIAQTLCSAHLIDGHFVRLDAVVDDGGRIVLDVTRTEFEAEHDTTMRVLLHVSDSITSAPDVTEPAVEVGVPA